METTENLKHGDTIYIVYWYNQDALYQAEAKIAGIYSSKDQAYSRMREVCGKGWKTTADKNMIANDHLIVYVHLYRFGRN